MATFSRRKVRHLTNSRSERVKVKKKLVSTVTMSTSQTLYTVESLPYYKPVDLLQYNSLGNQQLETTKETQQPCIMSRLHVIYRSVCNRGGEEAAKSRLITYTHYYFSSKNIHKFHKTLSYMIIKRDVFN